MSLANLVSIFFSNLLEKIQETAKEKIEQILRRMIKTLAIASIGIMLLLLGIFHFSFGVVKYLTVVFANEAAAYGVIGLFFVLVGIIILLIITPRR
ncbi:MAG: hypothetical protein QG670_398 [Thermoproteota archaeon]|nr:hypothetical protein [Thermoproteota archaeon]